MGKIKIFSPEQKGGKGVYLARQAEYLRDDPGWVKIWLLKG